MTRPNLDNIFLKSGEREELEQFFAYSKKFREDIKGNPILAREFLKSIGYFEMMEDERQEKEEASRTANAPEPSPVEHV